MSPWTVLGWMAVVAGGGYVAVYAVTTVVVLAAFVRERKRRQ